MAFVTEKHLEDSQYTYKLSPSIKKYTLMDTTFIKNRLGNYELTRILESVPNSGDGPLLKIIVNSDLTGFKLSITDKSGLKNMNIFKSEDNKMIQEKFYFQMNALVERGVFVKD
ncbi:MAG: DUF1831 domain-containing protein [Lactococcus raffinolactis]|nr:DUF1831 domain-containing protein [Lactococcus raffinolactis]MDN5493937.1 DUF1831 domain-containing protein [Lactococcus raffinolactis]MDN5579092.1 DUF1831 domain-containing protein [Lactococcus raffinolactis]MDN6036382.1 DUF1831 domain-containing protein [Lactococcus raffinolactis]MDN6043776.1 DUF1831 domain-containing protein [Lactococcus raffinolactis]